MFWKYTNILVDLVTDLMRAVVPVSWNAVRQIMRGLIWYAMTDLSEGIRKAFSAG